MKRSHILIVLVLALSMTTVLVLAQDQEPMANSDCAANVLGDISTQADQLYTDGQTAFQEGDVRTWLDNLRALSWLSSGLRAFCDGYVFEGDADGSASQVIGPVVFQPGIYIVTATTDGYIGVEITEIQGECSLYLGAIEGEAVEGTQEVLEIEDEPCTALLEINNLTEDWRVEFSLVSSG